MLPKVVIPSSSPTAYPVPPLVMKQDEIVPALTVTEATAPDPEPERVSRLAEYVPKPADGVYPIPALMISTEAPIPIEPRVSIITPVAVVLLT